MAEQPAQCNSPDEFRALAVEMWGAEFRTFHQLFDRDLPLIQDRVDFGSVSAELKVHLAETMIRESTSTCGAYSENGDPRWFLSHFARDMSVCNPVFDSRRIPAIQAAIMLLAYQNFWLVSPELREQYGDLKVVFGMGGSAVAGLYLLAQLEYLFRAKGDYLDSDGRLIQAVPPAMAGIPGLAKRRVGHRVNQIHLAFRLFLEGSGNPLKVRLACLDRDVYIEARLSHIRSAAMHGTISDPSGEGLFYALLIAMFYYSEPVAVN